MSWKEQKWFPIIGFCWRGRGLNNLKMNNNKKKTIVVSQCYVCVYIIYETELKSKMHETNERTNKQTERKIRIIDTIAC